MAVKFRCPSRRHDQPKAIWLKLYKQYRGSGSLRPWCVDCLREKTPTETAREIELFYKGVPFTVAFGAVSEAVAQIAD